MYKYTCRKIRRNANLLNKNAVIAPEYGLDDIMCPNLLGHSGRCIICEQTESIHLIIDHRSYKEFSSQLNNVCLRGSHKYCPYYGISHELVARELI